MDIVLTLWIIVITILWAKLVLVRALPLSRSGISRFELERRANSGDVVARYDLDREIALPRIAGLQFIIGLILLIVASLVTVYVAGWLVGAVTSILIGLIIDRLASLSLVRRLANHFYQPREQIIIEVIGRWSWLDWFTPVGSSSSARVYSKAELKHLLDRSPGVLSKQEITSVSSLLVMDDKTVSSIMTPRTMIEGVAVDEGVGPLVIDQLHKTGHSRFPVYDGDLDHIVGMLYLHDLINLKSEHSGVRQAMRPEVYYIHEDQTLEHALHGFLRSNHHLFIVVNEYRETIGVLSLEDVIEAILGRQIVDEFDEFHDLRKVAANNPKKNNQPKGYHNV